MGYGDLVRASGHLIYEPGGHLVYHSLWATRAGSKGSVYEGGSNGVPGTLTTCQSSAQSSFNADTTLSGEASDIAYRMNNLRSNYGYMDQSGVNGGYSKITLSAGDKTGLTKVLLSFAWTSGKASTCRFADYGRNPIVDNPYQSYFSLLLAFSESASTFGSGSDLAGMTPALTLLATDLAAFLPGGSSIRTGTALVLIDTSIISGMTGNDLYVWAYLTMSPAVPEYWGPTQDTAILVIAGLPSLLLYK